MTQMQPRNGQDSHQQKMKMLRKQMEANRLKWQQGDARAKNILKKNNQIEFEKKYKATLVNMLEKIIYEDISANIRAIAETVKGIKPDETVDHSSYVATRLMKKAMWATTSSIKYLFVRRRGYPPTKLEPRVSKFPRTAAKDLEDELSKIISEMTAEDAAIFLGRLSGMYFRICPRELFRDWRERSNKNDSTMFLTSTLEGELLMTIDF
jgi:hypothetical protein